MFASLNCDLEIATMISKDEMIDIMLEVVAFVNHSFVMVCIYGEQTTAQERRRV